MRGGKLLALVIIMLSALEEQVSGYYSYFFFGVFTYLKNDQKELTAKLSSRYCSVRITKANAITRRIGGGERKERFWSLRYLLEGTRWTARVVLGSLMFYLVRLTLSELRHSLTSPLWPPDLAETGPTSGEACCLSAHHHSGSLEGVGGAGHPHECQLPHPEVKGDQAVPTTFWASPEPGSTLASTH